MKLNSLDDFVRRHEVVLGTTDRNMHTKYPFMSGFLTTVHNDDKRKLNGIAGIYYFEQLKRNDLTRAVSAVMVGLGSHTHKRVIKTVSEAVGLIGFKEPIASLVDSGELRVDVSIEAVKTFTDTRYTLTLFIASDDYARIEPLNIGNGLKHLNLNSPKQEPQFGGLPT